MNGVRYHIGKGGVPRICTAKPGNCLYGGEYAHYDSYVDAQIAGQKKLAGEYPMLPSHDDVKPLEQEEANKLKREVYENRGVKPQFLQDENDPLRYERFDEPENADEANALLSSKLYTDNQSTSIAAAIRNPKIDRVLVDDILENLDKYSDETKGNLALNVSLSHDDLMGIVEKGSGQAQGLALRNKSLDEQFVLDFVKNRPEEIYNKPWVSMLSNRGLSKETKKVLEPYNREFKTKSTSEARMFVMGVNVFMNYLEMTGRIRYDD